MKFGAPFLGAFALKDPILIRDYVQAVEGLGFSHLFADEILLNDDPGNIYHELLTLFAFVVQIAKSKHDQTSVTQHRCSIILSSSLTTALLLTAWPVIQRPQPPKNWQDG